MIQFKLVNKENEKLFNTISFINVPIAKASDPNIAVLHDILIKFK